MMVARVNLGRLGRLLRASLRRRNGAGSLRRWTQSGIIAAPTRRSRILAAQNVELRLQVRSDFALKAQPRGTEFLDAETGRQKSSPKCVTPAETKIREVSGRKSPWKRPI